MTNHNFLYINNINLKQIKKDIDEINQRRFYGKLNVEYLQAPNDWDKEKDVIYISLKDENLGMWFNDENILEIRNQGNFGFGWVGYIIETELSVRYDVYKGGEGTGSEKWKGDLTKYNTYFKYLLMLDKSPNFMRRRWAKKRARENATYYDCKAFIDGGMNKMCRFYNHEWSKWKDNSQYIDERIGEVKLIQERICNVCGKKQRRSEVV